MDIATRYKHATYVAEYYENFLDFAVDGMLYLGFSITEIQQEIGDYIANGPRLRCVMAQRGEAKSTITALYALWRLIVCPNARVMVVSAGASTAQEIATLIIRMIETWDILAYLRADRRGGDRSSVEKYDVHWALKGVSKSPSVVSIGITGNMTGKRADVLIADDVEHPLNSDTVFQRQKLLQLTLEFSAVCTHGDIIWLGTPHNKDSIYNTLESRGYCIRVWPGRYPALDKIANYGGRLAPNVLARIEADPSICTGFGILGNRGASVDPGRYSEADLCEKELDRGPENFDLQYMLDTELADSMRQQLNLSNFLVANFDPDMIPEVIAYQADDRFRVPLGTEFPIRTAKMYFPAGSSQTFLTPERIVMYIDPAGGGSDEVGYAIGCAVGPYIHALDVGGIAGGLSGSNPTTLANLIKEHKVTEVLVESNMGHGIFELALRAEFRKPEHALEHIPITGEYAKGQKEKRIIDSLVSITQRHRLVMHQRVFESDTNYCAQHSLDKRVLYSLWHQIANITPDRNSLKHDDRIEALAGLVRVFKVDIIQDEDREAQARKEALVQKFLSNPMEHAHKKPSARNGTIHRIRSKRNERKR